MVPVQIETLITLKDEFLSFQIIIIIIIIFFTLTEDTWSNTWHAKDLELIKQHGRSTEMMITKQDTHLHWQGIGKFILQYKSQSYGHTYIQSIALDRAFVSLMGFLIDRYIWCGVISPTLYLVLATWYDHQGHLLAKPADTTRWQSRWNAGEKHGHWILPTSTYRAHRVLLNAVNIHGTDSFTSPPKEGVLRILSPLKSIDLGRVWTREPWVQWQAC
jgi:hypothetical protein